MTEQDDAGEGLSVYQSERCEVNVSRGLVHHDGTRERRRSVVRVPDYEWCDVNVSRGLLHHFGTRERRGSAVRVPMSVR